MARKRLLTVEEAIILHLLDYTKHTPENDVPMEMAQAGISRSLGVRRSHVSTSLEFARNRGTVEEALSRVKGEKRKRKCYFLTPAGLEAARGIEARTLDAPIDAVLPDGIGFSGPFEGLLNALEDRPNRARLALLCAEGRITISQDSIHATERSSGPALVPEVGHLVGRENELRQFERLFSGEVRLLALTGMPGIGKTWLAASAASSFGKDVVFWYSVNEWSSPRNLTEHLADFLLAKGHERLRRYMDTHEVPDTADVHDILLDVPLRFTILLDDCQNTSQASARFIDMLALACRSSKSIGLALVGRDIPEAAGKRLALDSGKATLIELGPLNEASSFEMLAAKGIPKDRAMSIAREGGGHPLYLSLMDTETGPKDRGDIVKMLASEIQDQLSGRENELMRLLSVFRVPVDSDALVDTQEDIGILDGLKKRCFISDQGGWSMHRLLRDFYLAKQAPADRQARHERAAEYYNRHPGDIANRIEEVHHLFMAGDTESAIIALLSWGSDMLARGYVDELLTMCAQVPDDWENPDDVLNLGILKASAQDLLGNWEDAATTYNASLEIAREMADANREAAILRRLGAIKYRQGDLVDAESIMKTAMGLTDSPRLTAELYGSLGVVLWRSGDAISARKAHESDLSISTAENDHMGTARALNNLGILDWEAGEHADAMDRYAKALKHAEKISETRLVAILYSNMGDVQRSIGHPSEAKRYYERCLELAEDLKFNWQVAEAYRGLAELEPEKRLDYLSRALTIFERLGAEKDAKTVREMIT